MQIEVTPSAKLLMIAAKESSIRPVPAIKSSDLPYGFVDLPELPIPGDLIEWPNRHQWKVLRRYWYPGTNHPPMLVLGLYDEPI